MKLLNDHYYHIVITVLLYSIWHCQRPTMHIHKHTQYPILSSFFQNLILNSYTVSTLMLYIMLNIEHCMGWEALLSMGVNEQVCWGFNPFFNGTSRRKCSFKRTLADITESSGFQFLMDQEQKGLTRNYASSLCGVIFWVLLWYFCAAPVINYLCSHLTSEMRLWQRSQTLDSQFDSCCFFFFVVFMAVI